MKHLNGFTLSEVLVAMLISGMVMIVSMQGIEIFFRTANNWSGQMQEIDLKALKKWKSVNDVYVLQKIETAFTLNSDTVLTSENGLNYSFKSLAIEINQWEFDER